MKSKYKRVCITGTSGTGKTTLANWISKEYDIPFISSSSGALWDEFGYKNHKDVVQDTLLNPPKGYRYQLAIADYRDELWKDKELMVTDRGPIDHAAYMLNYFQVNGDVFTKTQFLDRMMKQLEANFDALVFIRYSNVIIDDNGRRIKDHFFQGMMDRIMDMVISEYLTVNIPTITLPTWNFSERTEIIEKFLT